MARGLAETGALFFGRDLVLKDGRPTPYFVNMGMFKTGRLCLEMGAFFAGMMLSRGLIEDTDIILGPSYKGSAIALATSIVLWKEHGFDLLFEYDRKEAKSHGEAGAFKTAFVSQSFFDGCRIFVVDDVATSMSTKYDLLEKIEAEAHSRAMLFHVIGIGIGINREQTTAVYSKKGNVILGQKGTNPIQDFASETGIHVFFVAGIREVVEYLYREMTPVMIQGKRTPIDAKTKAEFDEYLATYGID